MQPTQIADPDFGDLGWDAKLHVWRGSCEIAEGVSVALWVNPISYMAARPPNVDEAWERTMVPASREAFAVVRRRFTPIRDQFLADAIVDFPRWNDGRQIDLAEFARRMTLETVSVNPDGTADLFFDDGGMFGGHGFMLELDPEGNVRGEQMIG